MQAPTQCRSTNPSLSFGSNLPTAMGQKLNLALEIVVAIPQQAPKGGAAALEQWGQKVEMKGEGLREGRGRTGALSCAGILLPQCCRWEKRKNPQKEGTKTLPRATHPLHQK